MKKGNTLQESKKGAKQKSNVQINERLRKHAFDAIDRLAELAKSKNESVALGANKFIVERYIPALKAIELTGKDGEALKGLVVIKTDGNKT